MKRMLMVMSSAALSASAWASSSLLQNGSFDQQKVADGHIVVSHSPAFLDGWSSAGTLRLVNPADGKRGGAVDGDNFVSLVNGATIYQNFTTVPGAVYTLSFAWDAVKDAASYFVQGGSKPLVAGSLGAASAANFQTRTVTFTALSGLSTLGFRAGGTGTLSLDHAMVAMVPEPSSMALFLAGLGGLGLVARRRGLKR